MADLTAGAVIRSWENWLVAGEALRREDNATMIDFYEGGTSVYDYIEQRRRESDDQWEDRQKRLRQLNICRMIPDRIMHALYGGKINRESDYAKHEDIMDIYKKNKAQLFFQQVALSASVLGTALVKPYINVKEEIRLTTPISISDCYPILSGYDYEILDMMLIQVATEDYDVNTGRSTPAMRKEIYTDEETAIYINDELVNNDDELGIVNPYGVIMWTKFPGRFGAERGDYWGLSDIRDVVEVAKFINELCSFLDELVEKQAHSTLFTRGIIADGNKAATGPSVFINVKDEFGEAKYITPEPKLDEILNIVESLLKHAFEVGCIPSVSVVSGEGVKSGIALLIEYKPFLDLVKQRQLLFEEAEIELYKKVALAEEYKRTGKVFSPEAAQEFMDKINVTIEFPSEYFPQDTKEGIEQDMMAIDAGFSTLKRKLRERYPDMTDVEIDALYQEVQDEKASSAYNTGFEETDPEKKKAANNTKEKEEGK